MPVMLAQNGHSYSAKVAREIAQIGFYADKKTRLHAVRPHFIGKRRSGNLPLPNQVWLSSATHHDSKVFKQQQTFKQQQISLSKTTLFGDMAFTDQEMSEFLALQQNNLVTPKKKPKGKKLTEIEKYCNQLVIRLHQPILILIFPMIIFSADICSCSVACLENINCLNSARYVMFEIDNGCLLTFFISHPGKN